MATVDYIEDVLGRNGGILPVTNAGSPATLGAKTSANSTSFTPATDATFTTSQSSKAVAAGDTNTAAANTAVVITLADPGVSLSNVIGTVAWSYSAAPTGGKLTVADSGTTVFEVDIIAGGPGSVAFTPPKKFTVHTATTVTLAAGSGAVVGKLNLTRWTE